MKKYDVFGLPLTSDQQQVFKLKDLLTVRGSGVAVWVSYDMGEYLKWM